MLAGILLEAPHRRGKRTETHFDPMYQEYLLPPATYKYNERGSFRPIHELGELKLEKCRQRRQLRSLLLQILLVL
jgi:hypothetical protein